MSETHAWDVDIEGLDGDICQWITDHGGWNAIPKDDVKKLLRCYFNQFCYGWDITPTAAETRGVVKYYFGDKTGGDTDTGCTF